MFVLPANSKTSPLPLGPPLRRVAICAFALVVLAARTPILASDLAPAGPIVISEIQYNPPPSLGADTEFEFVEIASQSDDPLDLSGWRLKDSNQENVFVLPAGTRIAPRGYLVVARNSAALREAYGDSFDIVGDVDFALANSGDAVRLFDAAGVLVDEVVYSDDLPWPTEADGDGSSLERISAADFITDFTNFAASAAAERPGTPGGPNSRQGDIPTRHDIVINEILYSAVKNPDALLLRHCVAEEFLEIHNRGTESIDVSNWSFADGIEFTFPPGTVLAPGDYMAIYRDADEFTAKYGEGINAIGPYAGQLGNGGEDLLLVDAADLPVDFVDYRDRIPWPINPDGLRGSLELADPFSDNARGQAWRESEPFTGTPGAPNSSALQLAMFGGNSGPQITRLSAAPADDPERDDIFATDAVRIEARVVDGNGVADAQLEYQLCVAGDYISKTDARFETDWTSVPMIYSVETERYAATIPAQPHRTLVRYRVVATDAASTPAAARAPFPRDPEPNLAYFVYDGVPDYTASDSAFGDGEFVHTNMDKLPVYHVIGTAQDIEDVRTILFEPRTAYHRRITFVHEHRVHDHVGIRLRGRGRGGEKPSWKFKFNKGNRFRGRFNDGERFVSARSKVNLMQGSILQGDAGVLPALAWKIYRDSGIAASTTAFVQLRFVRAVDEHDAEIGDFFGLYLDIQEPDKALLEDFDRPTDEAAGLYKFSFGVNKQHPDCNPSTDSVNTFLAEAPGQSREWVEANLDVPHYLSFRVVSELINHHDMDNLNNFYLYFNSDTSDWEFLPWDLDNTLWFSRMGGVDPLANLIVSFRQEYQNRFRFLWQTIYDRRRLFRAIDTSVELVRETANADFDRFKWSNTVVERALEVKGVITQLRGRLVGEFNDDAIPTTPQNLAPLPDSRPAAAVTLRAASYASPVESAHATTRWLIIEPDGNWAVPTWQLDSPVDLVETTVPDDAFVADQDYLFRVAFMDADGRWSFLSEPTSFTFGTAADTTALPTPEAPRAARVGVRSVELTWTPAVDVGSGVLGYRIFRDGELLVRHIVSGTHFTDYTAEPGATHEYQVVVVTGVGAESPVSAALTVKTGAGGRGGWQTPDGGWNYLYEARPGEDRQRDALVFGEQSLDGSWGPSALDEWDGSRPGEAGSAPGGIAAEIIETGGEGGGPVSVLTVEDPGSPGPEFVFPSNRRIMLLRPIGSVNLIDSGITLLTRLRVNPHPTDLEAPTAQTPPRPTFRGQVGIGYRAQDGRGHFSMWLDDAGLTTNLTPPVALAPHAFHAAWVTLQREGDEHRLRLYIDGSETAAFDDLVRVPSSGTDANADGLYLELGLAALDEAGSIQVDYVGYKQGVHAPLGAPGLPGFVRGDANGDSTVNQADALLTLGFLFGRQASLECVDAADTNDSGRVTISDAIRLLRFLFTGGAEPAAPFPSCGVDVSGDALSACRAGPCST